MPSSPLQRKKSTRPRLQLREWCGIAAILGFLGLITVSSHFSTISDKKRLASHVPYEKRELKIEIIGAVKHPGVYTCTPGTQLKTLLDKAGVAPEANRRKIALKKILISSQTVEIPKKRGARGGNAKFSLEKN